FPPSTNYKAQTFKRILAHCLIQFRAEPNRPALLRPPPCRWIFMLRNGAALGKCSSLPLQIPAGQAPPLAPHAPAGRLRRLRHSGALLLGQATAAGSASCFTCRP